MSLEDVTVLSTVYGCSTLYGFGPSVETLRSDGKRRRRAARYVHGERQLRLPLSHVGEHSPGPWPGRILVALRRLVAVT
jgi:hypothetical protein